MLFFAVTFVLLGKLKAFLVDYEAAQPTVKAQQVFDSLFGDPQWEALYDQCGIADTVFEDGQVYAQYMQTRMGSSQLTYLETSAGLSGDKKYLVRLDGETVASFTLVDHSAEEGVAAIHDWQLGEVSLFFTRETECRIVKAEGHTAYVNGVALEDDYTIRIDSTVAEEYLPEGTAIPRVYTQQVTGLLTLPTVTVLDQDGNQMEVTYDETTQTFTEVMDPGQISQEQQDAALDAAKTLCKWMIRAVKDPDTVAQYFEKGSDIYLAIVQTTDLWMQANNSGYDFADIVFTDYCQYSEEIFSVRLTLNMNVTRSDGTVKAYPYAKSMIFRKNDSGTWLCIEATNVDIAQVVSQVRLDFMLDDVLLYSTFCSTDESQLQTPTISPVPEGQVFSGWVRRVEEDDQTVLKLVFQPDADGLVTIPAGTELEPMTLYALFEDA